MREKMTVPCLRNSKTSERSVLGFYCLALRYRGRGFTRLLCPEVEPQGWSETGTECELESQ